jgi:hypothetical protein
MGRSRWMGLLISGAAVTVGCEPEQEPIPPAEVTYPCVTHADPENPAPSPSIGSPTCEDICR